MWRCQPEKEKARAAGDLDNRRTERTPRKCFRYGSEDHLITICPKPSKGNEKLQKKVSLSERGNCASQKECDNGENENNKKIYASIARMSDNDECPSRDFSDNSQLTNWILDLGAT